jgi:hypothetical protein
MVAETSHVARSAACEGIATLANAKEEIAISFFIILKTPSL